mmetsp:Transcript_84313/g.233729  ORF Transcript_84313/g.233729 Transcript_84313/m.233729 type:complete len:237 (-) Transcript_84313:662-1372(-)
MLSLGSSSAECASAGMWMSALTPRARDRACASNSPAHADGSRRRSQYPLKPPSTNGANSARCASRKVTHWDRYFKCPAPPSPSSWSEKARKRQAPSASTFLHQRPQTRSISSSCRKARSQPPPRRGGHAFASRQPLWKSRWQPRGGRDASAGADGRLLETPTSSGSGAGVGAATAATTAAEAPEAATSGASVAAAMGGAAAAGAGSLAAGAPVATAGGVAAAAAASSSSSSGSVAL